MDRDAAVSRRIALGLLLTLGTGCASTQPDIATLASNSDKVIYEEGMKSLQRKDWERARQSFKRIVEGLAGSELAPAARLAIGDSYVREGGAASYILAVGAFRDFLTLYPSHPRSDYAQFQVAEAYHKQKNGADRDQEPTRQALAEYERLLALYPRSEYIETARMRIQECRQALARHEFLVGYFYQRTRQAQRAAVARYEGILRDFPDYLGLDEVLYRLADALILSGRGAEAGPHLQQLLEEYPSSTFGEDARRVLASLPAAAPVASPAPPVVGTPSPTPAASPRPNQ